MPSTFAGLPPLLVLVLSQTGLPGVAIVLTYGQLVSQIYVEEFTLEFLNLPGCEFIIRLSLFTEYIGVCNFSWLLYEIGTRLVCMKVIRAKKTMNSTDNLAIDEALSPTVKLRGPNFDLGVEDKPLNWFDCLKYLWSSVATIGSVVIVIYGISSKTYILPVPVEGAFIIAGLTLTVLFYLEGLMIAIVTTQYWDPEQFREVYPRAYKIHKLINQPDNVKRFIIGRQFCTVLTGFLLAEIFTFAFFVNTGYNEVLFYIVIKSGLVGVLIVLSFGQLMPELLAAEFPLRFMNMRGSYSICYLSLIFDAIGVGHCAWAFYYITKPFCCKRFEAKTKITESKPDIISVPSHEIFAKTGSPWGKKLTLPPIVTEGGEVTCI